MENQTERNLLLAIVLSILVYVIYGYFAARNLPIQNPAPQAKQVPSAPARVEIPELATSETPPVSNGPEIEFVVESALYRAVISNTGGVIKSWKLKKYASDLGKSDYEMVPQYFPSNEGYLFRLNTGEESLDKELNNARYVIKTDQQSAADRYSRAPVDIVLLYKRPGLTAKKHFVFTESNYLVDVYVNLKLDGKEKYPKLIVGPTIGESQPRKDNPRAIPEAILKLNGKVTRVSADKIDGERKSMRGFAGLETQYFAVVFLSNEERELTLTKYRWRTHNPDKQTIGELPLAELQTGSSSVRVYVGPKEYDTLQKIDPALTELINYGALAFLVRGFLLVLKILYNYVHNYGVAIIILTFVLTLALFPLRLKQMNSMKKMQKMQPIIKAIQDKYKNLKVDNRQKQEMMQKEIWELHRQHGVNPLEGLGGCLLLLPQLPIFYAFNSLLGYTIELRKAPFAFWIQDLSDKDPYYVTPILMGISMLVQTKLTPTTAGADPAQQKQAKIMGLIFPVFLTFVFLSLSSGLNLYFLFSNLFGMALQKLSEQWTPKDVVIEPQRLTSPAGRK